MQIKALHLPPQLNGTQLASEAELKECKATAQLWVFRLLLESIISSCIEESGKCSSLGCAVQEENGHNKGENGRFFYVSPFIFTGPFCPANRGQRRKVINWLNVQMGWTLRVTSQVPNHLNSQT